MTTGNERIFGDVLIQFPHLVIVALPVGDVGDRKQFVGASAEVVVISEGSNSQNAVNSE